MKKTSKMKTTSKIKTTSKTTVHWQSTHGAVHIPLEISRFRSAIHRRCGHFFSYTGLPRSSHVTIWCCKNKLSLINWFWLNLISFILSLAFLGLLIQWEILLMSRLRLIKIEKFVGCCDWDSSRLRLIGTEKFLACPHKTRRDWKITCMSRPRFIETEKSSQERNGK